MGLFENLSLFENLMIRLGFVRVRRVLEGLRIIKNDAERIGAGYEIFGFKYTDVLEHAIVHGNFDPTRVSLDKAIIAYRKAAGAMLGVPPRQPEENPNHRKQEPPIPMPSPARADGKRIKHIEADRSELLTSIYCAYHGCDGLWHVFLNGEDIHRTKELFDRDIFVATLKAKILAPSQGERSAGEKPPIAG
jgi:hypothetical protein